MATIYKTGSTSKPSGLTIVRDGGLKFVVSWKIADKDYGDGHQLQWRAWKSEKKYTGWTTIDMNASATSKTITLSASDWFPTSDKPKLYKFEFQVRGKRNATSETKDGNTTNTTYSWSEWNSKSWKMNVPKLPTLTATLTSSYTTVFAWEGNNASDDNRPFSKFQWQSTLKQDCKETSGKKITGWGTITAETSDDDEPIEESNIAGGSYTRWFRIRSVGPAGYSEWRYAKHVYAQPKKATIKSVTVKKSGGNTNVLASWKAPSDAAHPIDATTVEYKFYKDTSYSGTGDEGITLGDTAGYDNASFMISKTAETDEVLFVRVVTKHDTDVNTNNVNATYWKPVDYGNLNPPSKTSGNDWADITSSTKAAFRLTNNSEISTSRIAIIYRGTNGKDICVKVTSAGSGDKTAELSDITIPTTAERAKVKFIAYAFCGSYSSKNRNDGVTVYTIDADATSAKLYDSETAPSVPVAPSNVTVTRSGTEAIVTWDRNWKDSIKTELSWSTNKNAWQSTDQPQTYVINDKYAHKWRIAGITSGSVWYFRVRFIDDSDEEEIYSPYCDRVELDLTAAPDTPILKLSKATVNPGGTVKASWIYECDDGIKQASAELCKVTYDNNNQPVYSKSFAKTETKKSIEFATTKWTAGQTYNIALRVTSKRGKSSGWSEPVPLFVGNPITCQIYETSIIEDDTVTDSDGNERTVNVLDSLPLTATITGAGNGGTTILIIERLEDYHMERPDGSFKDGYAGETIFLFSQTGEDAISIRRESLNGVFDDGARYRMIAIAEDGNGQSDSDEMIFEVHWDHQAEAPKNTSAVTIINGVAKITPVAPDSAVEGDTCDIYRLSADNPQLIVQGGTFGEDYADPYPTIGEHGGYRIVDITKYGDYITEGNQKAWIDIPTNLKSRTGFIHFGSESIPINYNVELSSSWSKDFKETKYLGGSVRGDWNTAVSRTGSVSITVPTEDTDTIQAIRRLADYTGICHVRTQDGSSFAADVQVSGNTGYSVAGKLETYSLTITRVDPQKLDGLPWNEWVTV